MFFLPVIITVFIENKTILEGDVWLCTYRNDTSRNFTLKGQCQWEEDLSSIKCMSGESGKQSTERKLVMATVHNRYNYFLCIEAGESIIIRGNITLLSDNFQESDVDLQCEAVHRNESSNDSTQCTSESTSFVQCCQARIKCDCNNPNCYNPVIINFYGYRYTESWCW